MVDSLTPGPLQLGTVWLPLQHVLTLPFIVNDWMWRSGLAGSIPSMFGYVLGVAGILRLVRDGLRRSVLAAHARVAAWLAAAIYAANPNLLYLQATALNEALFLGFFVWSLVFLEDFAARVGEDADAGRAARSLERCGMLLAAAILTRYDGWFLAAACGLAVAAMLWRAFPGREGMRRFWNERRLRRALFNFVLVGSLWAGVWLAYNCREFGDPLEFARGEHSARGIMQRTMKPGDPAHPGHQDARVAALYFLKAAKLNLGEGRWQGVLMWLAVGGTLVTLLARRWTWLLLWLPLPFYGLSVAYGAVPIFIPAWWPFSYYNTRYGVNLLPAAAFFSALLLAFVLSFAERRRARAALALAAALLAAGSYVSIWRATPVTLREVRVNSRERIAYEQKLAAALRRLPSGAALLMYTGDHGDALRRAGIRMRRVVSESNHPQWEAALTRPADWVDYLVAPEGGPVAGSARRHRHALEQVAVVESPGKPRTVIYRAR